MPHLRVTGASVGKACKSRCPLDPFTVDKSSTVSYGTVLLCALIYFNLCSMGVQTLQTLKPVLCFYLAVVMGYIQLCT